MNERVMIRSREAMVVACLLMGPLVSCVGSIEGAGPGSPSSPTGSLGASTGSVGAGGAGSPGVAVPPGANGSPTAVPAVFAPSVLQLTSSEYRNSVADLLGITTVDLKVDQDLTLSGYTNIGAASRGVSDRGVEQFEEASFAASNLAFGGAGRAALVGCEPRDAADACVRGFLTRFGRRAWRRPLTVPEIDRYVGVVKTVAGMSDIWSGVKFAAAGLLQSPHFVYRVEIGQPDPQGGRYRFDSYEMATRLSYFFWDTTPDDFLLDAADRNTLATVDGVRAAADRLSTSPRVRGAVKRLFGEYLALDALDALSQLPQVFPHDRRRR